MKSSPAKPDPMIGRMLLGRYRVLRHLADGGMGAIYLARNEGAAGFVKPVVIKWVLPSHSGDAKMTEMFMREARIMAKLSHPEIVSVLDFAEEDGMYIMALEYVHGFHLGRWYRFIKQSRGPFPVDVAVYIIVKVLRALEHAHGLKAEDGTPLNIVHRDVTPSNILIGVDGQVKLADFGIARIATEKTSVGDQSVKGKFPYLPREAFDSVPASGVTDMYSAAVTLHEILTGRNEFESDEGMAAVIGRVFAHVPTRVDATRGDVPAALADVIAKALEKEVGRRYASAGEFARALTKAFPLDEHEVAAKLAKLAAADFRDPRVAAMHNVPNLRELEAAWRTPTSPITGRPATPLPTPGPMAPRVSEPPQPRPRRTWFAVAIVLGVLAILGVGGVAVYALVIAKDKEVDEGPSYIVMDKRTDKPAASPAAAPPDAAPATAPDTKQLTDAFNKQANAVSDCFIKHAQFIPDDEVSIRFRIDTAGKVTSAEILPASIAPTSLGECLAQVARATQFGPQPKAATFRVPIRAKN